MQIIAFTDLRFLAKVSTKLHFFRQFKDHNSEWRHGNETNNPIFHLFLCSVSNFHFWIWKYSKLISMWSPLLVCKIHFWPKTTDLKSSPYLLKIEIVLFTCWSLIPTFWGSSSLTNKGWYLPRKKHLNTQTSFKLYLAICDLSFNA